MISNDRTIHAIMTYDDDSKIIETLNHNFQVLTERIKELNISLSYLDLLKISTIFTADSSADPNVNLQQFVSTCWNTLSNYAGVYIQTNDSADTTLFTWMNQYSVKNGDFIVKLPNNQSLYLPGAEPHYMIPTGYDTSTYAITFKPSTTAPTQKVIPLSNIDNVPHTAYGYYGTNLVGGSTVIPSTAKDCRFYTSEGEEIVFTNYKAGSSFTVPAGVPSGSKASYIQ